MSWSESWWVTRNIVKSIQKGKTTSAQTVTINEVDITRAIVLSVSKGSAGFVAARGEATVRVNAAVYNTGSYDHETTHGTFYYESNGSGSQYTRVNATEDQTFSLSGASTDLTVKQYSATLTSPTTLVTDGACEWQVIEFY